MVLDTQEDIRLAAEVLSDKSPQEVLEWAFGTYGVSRVALANSFGGTSGMVLLDMAVKEHPDVRVFYLDTDFLFPETYILVNEVSRRYGIRPIAVRSELTPAEQAKLYGEALWARDPDRCCDLRKVQPNRKFLRKGGYRAWVSGIRRDQSSTRRDVQVVEWDANFGLAKVNALANWTEEQVRAYIREHDVPYNALQDQGYPSIGCTYCTRPVRAGEDPRAGRWAGFDKVECGLHVPGLTEAQRRNEQGKGAST